jgi:hypothetical protein
MEDAVNKPLIAIATALVAATTMFASTAEAGFRVRLGFGGPLPAFTAYGPGNGYAHKECHRHDYRSVRHVERERVHVAKKHVKTESVAKADDTPQVTNETAEMENSSIASAPAKTAETTTPAPQSKVVAEVKDVGCKKFFPSVGMTLTVPCE